MSDNNKDESMESAEQNAHSKRFIDKLKKGFKAFLKEFYIDSNIMPDLAENGQTPKAAFFGCMDARAVLADIFNLKPNDVFVVKGIGNIHPKYNPNDKVAKKFHAELSLALDHFKVEDLFTTSHTQCGAAALLATGGKNDPRIMEWLNIAGKDILQDAKNSVDEDVTTEELSSIVEQQIVINNYKMLIEYPCVIDAMKENRLTIHPWIFDMKRGQILEYSPESNKFEVANGFDLK